MNKVHYARTKTLHHFKNYAHELLSLIPYEYDEAFCIFSEPIVEEVTFYIATFDPSLIDDLSASSEGEFDFITADEIPKLKWDQYGNDSLMPV